VTIYGVAVTTASSASDAAGAFIAFMTDPEHHVAWTHAGFDLAT
jgi:ABC-type glycerol-3-phosphate transport system substrate-binding protein